MTPEELAFRAGRWPWSWTKFAKNAATLCKQEVDKFRVLQSEHHLLRLECSELHKLRVVDAERHQTIRDEYQLLKSEASALREREKLLSLELDDLKAKHATMTKDYLMLQESVPSLFEHIRRLKNGKDDRGNQIPTLFRR